MWNRRAALFVLSLSVLTTAVGVSPASEEEVPSFKKRGDMEKTFYARVGAAVVRVARSKPQKVSLLSHELKMDTPKRGRAELTLKMEYFGLVTKRRYTADVSLTLDTSDKDNWEVIDLRYSDTNPNVIGPNERKIQEMKRAFNK